MFGLILRVYMGLGPDNRFLQQSIRDFWSIKDRKRDFYVNTGYVVYSQFNYIIGFHFFRCKKKKAPKTCPKTIMRTTSRVYVIDFLFISVCLLLLSRLTKTMFLNLT